jgi:hypothetical protein
MRRVLLDFNMGSVCCVHNNCFSRTFYVIRQRDFKKSLGIRKKTGEFETPFRLMLICTKCGTPEVYGD